MGFKRKKKDYEPAWQTNDDEIFHFGALRWNVTKMKQWIKENVDSLDILDIPVEPWAVFIENVIRHREDHIDEVNIAEPLIAVEMLEDSIIVVDGAHRILKAKKLGIENLKTYFLPFDLQVQFLINEWEYEQAITMWNNDCEQRSKKELVVD